MTLTLLLPGALVPPAWSRDAQWAQRVDRADAAQRLARADAQTVAWPDAAAAGPPPAAGAAPCAVSCALPHERWLAQRFGLISAAAWHAASAHADGLPDAQWRIEPASLEVGLNRVALAALPGETLSEQDARALADAGAPVLREHGLRLRRAPAGRWYLDADEPLRLATGTPLATLGRSIEACLPIGSDARRWRRALTEVEMTWHAHPVNAERERTRRAPVNSLWLTGPVPPAAAPSSARPGLLIGNDACLRGMAAATGSAWRETLAARGAGEVEPDGQTLWLADALLRPRLDADPAAWIDAWEAIASGPLREVLAALDDGRVDQLEIVVTGESRVLAHRLRRADRWRPWRRLRSAQLAGRWSVDEEPAP